MQMNNSDGLALEYNQPISLKMDTSNEDEKKIKAKTEFKDKTGSNRIDQDINDDEYILNNRKKSSKKGGLNFNYFNNGNALFISNGKEDEEEILDEKQGSGSTAFSSTGQINYNNKLKEERLLNHTGVDEEYYEDDERNLPAQLLIDGENCNEGDGVDIGLHFDIGDDDDEDDDYNPLEAKLQEQAQDPERITLIANLLTLAKEQSSSRYLQQKIDEDPELGSKYFYPTIISHINDLIINPFGNYLVQKIFIHITEAQRTEILQTIEPNLLMICVDFYGTRVIQNFIESIQTEALMHQILRIVKNRITALMNDIHGSYIIIKFLSLNKQYITDSIYESINMNIVEISMNKHGCCEIQKILEDDVKNSNKIISHIIKNCIALITHQCANYTVLFVLNLKNQTYTNDIIRQILLNFGFLAKQTYSSTIIEKCFELCDDKSKEGLFQVLINRAMLQDLLLNKYGNYVVQKALNHAPENIKTLLLYQIAPLLWELQKQNYGKQVCARLFKNYPKLIEITNAINTQMMMQMHLQMKQQQMLQMHPNQQTFPMQPHQNQVPYQQPNQLPLQPPKQNSLLHQLNHYK